MQSHKKGTPKKTDADLLAIIRKALKPQTVKLIHELPNIDELRRLAYMVPESSFQITYANGEFIFAVTIGKRWTYKKDEDPWSAYDMMMREIREWTKQPG